MLRLYTILLAILVIDLTASHPTYHHQFKKIINENLCLKKCMKEATSQEQELNMLKTNNVTGYLLNIHNICK